MVVYISNITKKKKKQLFYKFIEPLWRKIDVYPYHYLLLNREILQVKFGTILMTTI